MTSSITVGSSRPDWMFYLYGLIVIFISTTCSVIHRIRWDDIKMCCTHWLARYQGETTLENRRSSGPPGPLQEMPIKLDSEERKSYVLSGLVEQEVTAADLVRHQSCSQNIVNLTGANKQFNIRASCSNDLEAIHVEVELFDPCTDGEDGKVEESGTTSEALLMGTYRAQISLRELSIDLEAAALQTGSIFHAEKHLIVDSNTPCVHIESVRSLVSAECTICMEEYKNGDLVCRSRNLSCDHAFHTDCLLPWLMRHDICPNCRSMYLPPIHTEI